MKRKVLLMMLMLLFLLGISTISTSAAEQNWWWPCMSALRYSDGASGFGYRSISVSSGFHRGVDIPGAYGAEVIATRSGIARIQPYSNARGKHIVIDHEDGYYSVYQHLSGFAIGDDVRVNQGDVIGYVGATGNVDGTHLHFEVHQYQAGYAMSVLGIDWQDTTKPVTAIDPKQFIDPEQPYGKGNPPSTPSINISAGDSETPTTISWHSDNAHDYWIAIRYSDDTWYKSFNTTDTSWTNQFTPGTYKVHVEAVNDYGRASYGYIDFTVPVKPLWRSYAIANAYKNGHLYSLFDIQYDWDTAKTQVAGKGGHLATITSAEENDIITNLISQGSKNQYWIGYTDKDNEGVWKWITGEESDYSNWGSGEPNNTADDGGSENYGTYAKSTKKWNDTVSNISSVGVIYETESFTPTATVYNNNIKYEIYDYGMSWTEAKQFCEDKHGHLVTIDSSAEDNVIAELVNKGKWEDYWIGCTDEGHEGTWEWITGEKFDYKNWNSSEPNNSGGVEHYGSYVKSKLKWNDAPNVRTKYGIIVEYDDEAWNGYLSKSTIIYKDSVLAVYNRPFSWTEAQEFCQSASGNLVTIEDAEKQNAVFNLVHNAGSHFYIGYTDKDSEGNWKWISGKNSTYTNWNSGEPNNSDGNEDYCEFNALQDGKWNDIDGGMSSSVYRGFVLEINNLDYAAETQFNGNTYYRFDNPTPWTEARAYCEMLGGHLVSIASEDENTAMKDFISDGAKSNYWIGYTDYRKEGDFTWVDGAESSYTNWNTNEPNNCLGCENYATIKKSGLWNDLRSSEFTSCGFICEIEADEPETTSTPTPEPDEPETTSTPTPEPDEPTPPVADGAIVKVSSSAVSAGNTVDIAVDLSGNEGFANLGIQIAYDSDALTLISASNNSDVGATYTSAQNLSANPFNMGWDSTSNVTYNGNLATLTFKVNDNATDGTYPITVSYYKGIGGNYTDGEDVNYDADFNSLNLNYVNGIITVSSHVAGDINGDGKVNNQDGTFLLRHLAGWNVNVDESALDINGDGKVNSKDGTLLLRYLAGWSVTIQ